jgi:hypothetical protein
MVRETAVMCRPEGLGLKALKPQTTTFLKVIYC